MYIPLCIIHILNYILGGKTRLNVKINRIKTKCIILYVLVAPSTNITGSLKSLVTTNIHGIPLIALIFFGISVAICLIKLKSSRNYVNSYDYIVDQEYVDVLDHPLEKAAEKPKKSKSTVQPIIIQDGVDITNYEKMPHPITPQETVYKEFDTFDKEIAQKAKSFEIHDEDAIIAISELDRPKSQKVEKKSKGAIESFWA